MIINSIKQVVELGLCVGCGTCVSICPFRAVKIVKDNKKGIYKPVLNEKCIRCGICLETCYGIELNPKLSMSLINESKNSVIGTYSNCYVGYSSDNEIRYSSASGGIVSALLLFALEEKMVDGVLVSKMDEKNPLEPKPFIAKTKSDVISAARSKYCPIPVNIMLKILMQENGHYAVIGLPCHIYGIKKAESIYPEFRDKILFHIGIFCGGMPNFLATEYLLKKFKLRKEEIKKIEYRGEGWPGMMLIELKGKHDDKRDKLLIPYPNYWEGLSSFFLPYRCTLCDDGFNKFADVSCGDAWLPEYQGDKLGTSIIITRNEIGEQLINEALKNGKIQLANIDCKRVKQSQKPMIQFKTQNIRIRFQLLRTLRKPLPLFHRINIKTSQLGISIYFRCVFFYLFWFMASKRYMWFLLDIYRTLKDSRLKIGLKKLNSKLKIP